MPDSKIIICGTEHDIGHPVTTWRDPEGFNSYTEHRTDEPDQLYAWKPAPGLERRKRRYRPRRSMLGRQEDLGRLQRLLRQVVVHLDGCRDAAMCFNVLHNERGLSVHFMVDTDGSIYQCLDLVDCAFHAAGVNEVAVGIELQNRGDAARDPGYYGGERATVACTVHGHQFLCFEFTDAQYHATARLCRALVRLFDLPLASPRAPAGPIWTTIDDPRTFRGFLGHYHVSADKWDPGCFDFQRLFRGVGTRVTLPLTEVTGHTAGAAVKGQGDEEGNRAALLRLAGRYHDNAEREVSAHFPVGPLGRSRLWHGGVHLRAPYGAPVHAVAGGRLVAARSGAAQSPCPVGSCNFVLVRHTVSLGSTAWTFFSLYYHLAGRDDRSGLAPPRWQQFLAQRGPQTLSWTEVLFPGVPVQAGERIGAVGEAGPMGARSAQIHFAIFSAEDRAAQTDPRSWDRIESPGGSRLCSDASLLARIDRPLGRQPPDGLLSRRELRYFFRHQPHRRALRRLVVRHRSEWTPEDWDRDLLQAPDFAALSPLKRQQLLDQQVRPTLWWTPDVAEHCGLPADGMVYSYHPVTFVLWLAELLGRQTRLPMTGVESASSFVARPRPGNLTLDRESGDNMVDEEDFLGGDEGRRLTLEDLARGYDDSQ